jgi:hypothetical protein
MRSCFNVLVGDMMSNSKEVGEEIVEQVIKKGDNKVYRGLAEGENITQGLSARTPGAGNSPVDHVAGKKETQWISTTKDKNIATNKYGEHGVVEIDLSKVQSEMVDFSNGIPDMRGMISNWAKKDKEVLIKDYIPPEAIKSISQ